MFLAWVDVVVCLVLLLLLLLIWEGRNKPSRRALSGVADITVSDFQVHKTCRGGVEEGNVVTEPMSILAKGTTVSCWQDCG